MSIGAHDELLGPQPEVSLTELVRDFDETRHTLLKDCRIYSCLPFPGNAQRMAESTEEVVGAWTNLAALVLEDDTISDENKVKTLAVLIEEDNYCRGIFLEKLIASEGVFTTTIQQRNIAVTIEARMDEEDYAADSLVEELEQLYEDNLARQLAVFKDEIRSMPKGRYAAAAQLVGKRSLDAAKIGAGLWLGMKLVRRD